MDASFGSDSGAEDPIRARARQQAEVARLGMMALSGTMLADLLHEAVAVVARIFGAEFAEVLQLEADGLMARRVAAVGWNPKRVEPEVLAGGSQAALALVSRRPVATADLAGEWRFAPTPEQREQGVVSGIHVKIAGEEKPWGILGAHATRPRRFDPDDVNFFLSVANVIAEAAHRQRQDEALRASEERFRSVARATNDAIWDWDIATDGLWWSEGFSRLFGFSPEEIEPNIGFWAGRVHPEDREEVVAGLNAAIEGDSENWSAEYRFFHKDGRVAHVLDRGHIIRDAEGRAIRAVGGMTDVTERQRSLVELARVNRALKMLSSCNENLIRATDERQLLEDTCRLAVEIGGYRMAWVGYAVTDAERSIQPVAHHGEGADYLSEIRLTWGGDLETAGPGGRTIRTGQAQVCEDIEDPAARFNFREGARIRGFRGVISLPLREGERAFGLLALLTAEVHPVSAEEVKLLQELADDLAFGIRHIRAQRERQRMETAVQKMAATVAASSGTEFYRELARNMAEAVGARAGFVVRLVAEKPGIGRTLAAVVDGERVADFEYDTARSPCAEVLRTGRFVMKGDVGEAFPRSLAARFEAGAYAGRVLKNGAGEAVGLAFVLFSEWPDHSEFIRPTLQVFADRAAAELEIEQADLLIREQASLLDQARDAILVRGLDHRILFWNKGAERLYGWSAAEAVGRIARDLLFSDPRTIDEAYEGTMREGEWSGELEQVDRDGRPLVVEGRWTLLRDAAGQPKSILSINTDVTEQKLLQQQFLRSQRLESIGTLAGGIAHDLNNVLAPIAMSIELLHMKLADERSRELLETIAGCARRGADMIAQVLSFGRGVEGRRIEIRVGELVGAIERILRDTFPKNLEIVTDCPPDLWTVSGDPTQLHQVLLNLCVNARDAMSDGGTMTIRASNVPAGSAEPSQGLGSPDGPHVCLEVVDTGAGIPADMVDKVFDPFFTTKGPGEGTGLGLSTSMAIVRSHQGFMHVSSRLGIGSRFRFCLPALGMAARPTGENRVLPPPRGNGQTVLMVDDEEALREVVRRTLEEFGYRVLLAADGAEALEIYGEHRREIALVVTDLMMPRLDGRALIRQLHALDPELPVIATSGFPEPGPAELAGEAASRFLAKPYDAASLLGMIAAVFSAKA